MSINFGQFPTPRLPLIATDAVVGYQVVTGVPTLAQYTMLQLAGIVGALIPSEPPSGPAGGDLSGTYPNPTVAAVHATSGTLNGVAIGATTASTGAFTTLSASGTVSGAGFTTLLAPYGLLANPISQFAATTSAQLAGKITDETGTGSLVFGTSPTIASPTVTGTAGFVNITASGTVTPSQTAGIVGTTTNNNANAGSVGEFISSTVASGSAVALTNSTATNITSISLTAGDWDVWGESIALPAGTTTTSNVQGWVNTVSAAAPATGLGAYFQYPYNGLAGGVVAGQTGILRVSVASTTTIFLGIQATFAVSTCGAYGYIAARRRR